MSFVLEHLGSALRTSFAMFWEILWPLSLGFLLSAVVETLVSKRALTRALGKDSSKSVGLATAFGAASSSCSYAAVAIARSLFRRGATFANAIIFEFASTNLVFELGLVLLALLGWKFVGAEFAGGLIMITLLAIAFRLTLRKDRVEAARAQAEKGLVGKMEGHGAMDMSITEGPLLRRLASARGQTAISHYYFMNIYSLWFDLAIGLLAAGALAAWVPDAFWSKLFITGHGSASDVWGALIGPLIAVVSFVCSVGNIPLAAVLWRGGISFSGVIAFIFADLIIIPILLIYRKYYGRRMAAYLFVVSYVAMVLAGLSVGGIFNVFGWTPTDRHVTVLDTTVSWNYDTFLNIAFLLLSAVLGVRFLRTGGIAMLEAMEVTQAATRDPVCGMAVDPEHAPAHLEHGGTTFHFCSTGCMEAFAANPDLYLESPVQPGEPRLAHEHHPH